MASPLRMATAEQVQAILKCPPGFIGPVDLPIPVIADHSAAAMTDFVCGANEEDWHLTGVNWGRDTPERDTADLRNIVAGDPSPGGGGAVKIARGIEVGHIFQLGDKYSRAMNATVLDQDGKEVPMLMGCYGIGVSRIVAAAIEQNHDEHGIIWPEPMAPFQVIVVMLNPKNSDSVTAAANGLYDDLRRAGIDVLLDDRPARPGVKFADADLLGIPHRLTVGERGLAAGHVEYRARRTGTEDKVTLDDVVSFIQSTISAAQV